MESLRHRILFGAVVRDATSLTRGRDCRHGAMCASRNRAAQAAVASCFFTSTLIDRGFASSFFGM
ncbi:MAG TPA: hypothetical protein VF215_16130, partial [Thermoanaerobaculia bacterium]